MIISCAGRVDGGWSDWASWSECSVTCGGGSQSRFRRCTNPPPSGGGDQCTGEEFERQNCNENRCPGMFAPSLSSPRLGANSCITTHVRV